MMKIENIFGVVSPLDNQVIARYLDRKKLNLLINSQEIWYSNAKQFYDKHEREIPNNFFKYWPDKNRETYLILNNIKQQEINAFVSCWTKFDSDNYAMWKIYDKESSGACITTTVGKLKKQINRDDMFLCEVQYYNKKDKGKIDLPSIDYGPNSSPYCMRVSESYKIQPYEYEKEIRSIIYSREKSEGISVKISLKDLVDDIYISPFSNATIAQETKDILYKVFDEKLILSSDIFENT